MQLNDLNQKGSGVIGIQSTNGVIFDTIVYGEKTPHAWMAGSDTHKRSQNHGGQKEELAKAGLFLQRLINFCFLI